MGNFILNQLAQPKGFAKHKNGKPHPVFEKKGITEDQMKISVKGNNDTIEVGTKKPTGGMKGNRESNIKDLNDLTIQQLRIIEGMNGGKGRDPESKKIAKKLIKEKLNEVKSIEELSDDYVLNTDSQDVESIRDYLGGKKYAGEYDGYYTKEKNGDFAEVWGFNGMPYLETTVYRVN